MADIEKLQVHLSHPAHYTLPDDLRFVGLTRNRNSGAIGLRFSRKHATVADIPLSLETLADIVQALSPLHGRTPHQMPEELEDLRKKGLPLIED